MNSSDLDGIDYAIAQIEGFSAAFLDSFGQTRHIDQSLYRPSRDPIEAFRLMEKYILKIVRLERGWAAVGLSGRCSSGPTLPIAVCIAVIEAQ